MEFWIIRVKFGSWFICVFDLFQDRALDYLSTCIDQVNSFGDILQLVIVELIYKVGIKNITEFVLTGNYALRLRSVIKETMMGLRSNKNSDS